VSTKTSVRTSFIRGTDGTWLVQGPASEIKPGKVVKVNRKDGTVSIVVVTEVVDQGTPVWAGSVEIAAARTVRPGRWARDDGGWILMVPTDLLDFAKGPKIPVARKNGTWEIMEVEVAGPANEFGWVPCHPVNRD